MSSNSLAVVRPTLSVDTLREQFAPKATDLELVFFGQVCQRLDLDPFKKEIYLIGRNDKQAGKTVHRPQLSIEGRRVIAERTGFYDGMVGPEWCPPRRYDGDGNKLPLEWMEVWDDDDTPPYAARAFVYRTDRKHPANGTVKWSEFAYEYGDKLRTMYRSMPSHMLGKCAEALALGRAFTQVAAAVALVGSDDFEPPEHQPAASPPRSPVPPEVLAEPPASGGAGQPNPWERVIRQAADRADLTPAQLDALAADTCGKPYAEAVRSEADANQLLAAVRQHAQQQAVS